MNRSGRKPRRDYSEVRRFSAHRRAGHEWWKWYVIWEPLLRRVGPGLLALAGLAYLWFRVPHLYLGIAAGVLAVAILGVWVAWTSSDAHLQRAMTGGVRRGTGLGWAVGAVCTALVGAAWLAIWGPGA